jgi:adenylosuccinate synthase
VLCVELDRLRQRGVSLNDRLMLSSKAHIILPHHIALDQWREKGKQKIGTTGRGIGPAYEMKAARFGVRLGDLLYPESLKDRILPGLEEVQRLVGSDVELLSLDDTVATLLKISEPLLGFIGDTHEYLLQAWDRQESILFEGAQATLLDIDHGTYPYVTSSSCSLGGLFTGTGLPPKALSKVLGVAKAYTTRVGAGPFPSELNDATGELLRKTGNEFGTTTGRPRRCGWLDAAITRYACRTNGVDGLCLMKMDVLDVIPEIGLVVGYRDGEGRVSMRVPTCQYEWSQVQPEIRVFPGWLSSTRGATAFDQLPPVAQRYLEAVVDVIGTPIAYLSTGPDRHEGFVWPGSFLEDLLK